MVNGNESIVNGKNLSNRLIPRSDTINNNRNRYEFEYQYAISNKTTSKPEALNKKLSSNGLKSKEKGKLNIKDMFINVMGVTILQISSQDKYTQVSLREEIKRHGTRSPDVALTKYIKLDNKIIFDL